MKMMMQHMKMKKENQKLSINFVTNLKNYEARGAAVFLEMMDNYRVILSFLVEHHRRVWYVMGFVVGIFSRKENSEIY